MANDLFDLHELLHTRKDTLVDLVNEALGKAGLNDVVIKSIRLDITKRAPACPDGKEPVWESVTLPDGTVIIQLVCK